MKATTSDLERERVRAALAAIVERSQGVLNPRDVLDVARDPAHVLHSYFDWDDTSAGERYRLLQVGVLVRHVRLTVVKPDPVTREVQITTTRGYQSRPSMRRSSGGYEQINAILADSEKRAELLAQVVRELASYRRRYAELSELHAVWLAVDDLAMELAPATDDAHPGLG